MGLIINGISHDVPGVEIHDFVAIPGLHLDESDFKPRTDTWVNKLIAHTTEGTATKLCREVSIPPGFDAGQYWRDAWAHGRIEGTTKPDHAGAHLVGHPDGVVSCLADLRTEAAHHAGLVNQRSIGYEIHQARTGEITVAQLRSFVRVAEYLTALVDPVICIPPVFHNGAYRNAPLIRMQISWARNVCSGIFGHRDITNERGQGDAGDEWRAALLLCSEQFFPLDFVRDEDIAFWKKIQTDIGGLDIDGIPGPKTLAAWRNRQ